MDPAAMMAMMQGRQAKPEPWTLKVKKKLPKNFVQIFNSECWQSFSWGGNLCRRWNVRVGLARSSVGKNSHG